jgi:hypothetical protein
MHYNNIVTEEIISLKYLIWFDLSFQSNLI